jgi:hypothetical protein
VITPGGDTRHGVATYSQWRYRQTLWNKRLVTTNGSRRVASQVVVEIVVFSERR